MKKYNHGRTLSLRALRPFKILKNKGGRALIYNIKNVFRVVFRFFTEEIKKCRIRFFDIDKALNFSKRVLIDYYIKNIDNAFNNGRNRKIVEGMWYPAYRDEYFRDRVFDHDGLKRSYWYMLGSSKAYVSTYKTKPSGSL